MLVVHILTTYLLEIMTETNAHVEIRESEAQLECWRVQVFPVLFFKIEKSALIF